MPQRLSNDIIKNLLCAYRTVPEDTRTQGQWWYDAAREELMDIARAHDLPIDAVCGATAALSPGRSWHMNVRDVVRLLGGDTRVGSYGEANVRKALLCLTGEPVLSVLSGPKVTAFYQCLSTGGKHPTAVCLDRHMKRIAMMSALPDEESRVRPHEYDWLASHYRLVARMLTLRPSCLQAVLWCRWQAVGARMIQDAMSDVRGMAA